MIVYLDSNVVIYLVENDPAWGPKAANRVAALRANGDELAVSDLTRLECRVKPLRAGDLVLLGDFDSFFSNPGVKVYPLTAAVCDRAALIRAQHGFRTPDSLHLAAAAENGCGLFFTNDPKLSSFPDVNVEVLS